MVWVAMRARVWVAAGGPRWWCHDSLSTKTSQHPHAASRTSWRARAAEPRGSSSAMPHARGASVARHRQRSRWWRWHGGSTTARAAVAALLHTLHGGNALVTTGAHIRTGQVTTAALPPPRRRCRSGQRTQPLAGRCACRPSTPAQRAATHPRVIAPPPRRCHAMTASQRPRHEPQQAPTVQQARRQEQPLVAGKGVNGWPAPPTTAPSAQRQPWPPCAHWDGRSRCVLNAARHLPLAAAAVVAAVWCA